MASKSVGAATAIKKLKKEAMILRNFPSLPSYGVFQDVDVAQMELELINNFEIFLQGCNVEVISVNDVLPMDVFNLYFALEAPFAFGKKSEEFSDAFVLETLKKWSINNNEIIHVISDDGDMQRYCSAAANLRCSSRLDEFIEAVNRNHAAGPSEFADKALKHVSLDLLLQVKHIALSMETLVVDLFELTISERIEVQSVSILESELMSISEDVAEYTIEFSVEVASNIVYESLDFDSDDYVFDQKYERTAKYTTSLHAFLVLGIKDQLLEKSKIINIDEYSGVLLLDNAREITCVMINDAQV